MTFHQRRIFRDKEFPEGLLGSRVFQRCVLHVDLHGILENRQLTGNQRDLIVGGYIQIVKSDDLDLGGVGSTSHVGNGISEGGDQAVCRAVLVNRHRACAQLVSIKGEGEAVVDVFRIRHRDGDLTGNEFDLAADGVENIGVGNVVSLCAQNDDFGCHGGYARLGARRIVIGEGVAGNTVAVGEICGYGGMITIGNLRGLNPNVHGFGKDGIGVCVAVSGLSKGGGGHGAHVVLAGVSRRYFGHGGKLAVLGILIPHVAKDGGGAVGQGVAV